MIRSRVNLLRLLAGLSLAVLISGCDQQGGAVASSEQQAEPPLRLPVSLNDVMVAMVNNAADPIWLAAWRPPTEDEGWRALERSAYQLEIAGSLLAVPGTGPLDEKWTVEPEWRRLSHDLRDAGSFARAAVAARDMDAIRSSGDRIVEICEGCHIAFKPAVPTGGKYGELSPTQGDFSDE